MKRRAPPAAGGRRTKSRPAPDEEDEPAQAGGDADGADGAAAAAGGEAEAAVKEQGDDAGGAGEREFGASSESSLVATEPASIKQEPGDGGGPRGAAAAAEDSRRPKMERAHHGKATPSTPPKAAAELSGGGKGPLATAEMGLGSRFGGWSSRSARLLAVYVRQHYKQARPADWTAMAHAGDGDPGGDSETSTAESAVRRTLLDRAQEDAEGPTAARSIPGQPEGEPSAAVAAAAAAAGPTVIDMDTDDINVDLNCPICLGVIRKTVTTIECLHRFCTECIEKSLRLGQKECPTCRIKCPSRRFLRPDPNFDALIAAVYPDLDKWEMSEFARIDELNKNHTANHQELLKNLKEMQEDQKTVRKQRAGRADYIYNGDVGSALTDIAAARMGGASGSGANINICLTRSVGCSNVPKLVRSDINIKHDTTIGKSRRLYTPTKLTKQTSGALCKPK